MSIQAATVCLKAITQFKKKYFVAESLKSPDGIKLIHNILHVFDSIASQCRYGPLSDYIIILFLHYEEQLEVIKEYCLQIFSDEKCKNDFRREPELFEDLKVRIFSHFTILVELIGKKYTPNDESQGAFNNKNILQLLSNLSFLSHPVLFI